MKEKTIKQNKIDIGELQEIALLLKSGASGKSIADLFNLNIEDVELFKGGEI